MIAARECSLALILLSGAGCANRTSVPVASDAGAATGLPVTAICAPGNQDAYVYRPARLRTLAPCVRARGTIVKRSMEADGDIHLRLRLDAPDRGVLNAGSAEQGGNLVVEPVCQFPPMQADAIRICASDPDPFPGPLPSVGDHVWIEGRYVVEVQHDAWTELHPLYRWGVIAPEGRAK
jgi:hypothetical protein